MSPVQVNHNQELLSLQNEGYDISIVNGTLLLVSSVPYVNKDKSIMRGDLIFQISFANQGMTLNPPNNHTAHFRGNQPCDKNGAPLLSIINSSNDRNLGSNITSNHYFSARPHSGRYKSHYEKITTYVNILSSQAQAIDDSVTAKTHKPIKVENCDSPLVYFDTNSARALISDKAERLKGLKVGIIGLGGTGSCILDWISKTHVKEIHLLDGDDFHSHNAFRSPGAASFYELTKSEKKVIKFKREYSKMHKGLIAHLCYVTKENLSLLDNLDFVFLSIDSNFSRRVIAFYLHSNNIPFIDCGMGVNNAEDGLRSTMRVTLITRETSRDYLQNSLPINEEGENEYDTNIQIGEFNALNACLAVIEFKKFFGLNAVDIPIDNLLYSVSDNILVTKNEKKEEG